MGWMYLAGGLKLPCSPPMAPEGAENGSTSLETMGSMDPMDPMGPMGPALDPVWVSAPLGAIGAVRGGFSPPAKSTQPMKLSNPCWTINNDAPSKCCMKFCRYQLRLDSEAHKQVRENMTDAIAFNADQVA